LLELLAEMPERFGVRLHAYVLMDNHFHLLIETAEASSSRLMVLLARVGIQQVGWTVPQSPRGLFVCGPSDERLLAINTRCCQPLLCESAHHV
jgi:hypothetical protein